MFRENFASEYSYVEIQFNKDLEIPYYFLETVIIICNFLKLYFPYFKIIKEIYQIFFLNFLLLF